MISYYYDNLNIDGLPEYQIIVEDFQNKFSLEKIKSITLEEYDFKGKRDTLAYYIEQKTKPIYGGSFGQKKKKKF